jgi:hypothetical protein
LYGPTENFHDSILVPHARVSFRAPNVLRAQPHGPSTLLRQSGTAVAATEEFTRTEPNATAVTPWRSRSSRLRTGAVSAAARS